MASVLILGEAIDDGILVAGLALFVGIPVDPYVGVAVSMGE